MSGSVVGLAAHIHLIDATDKLVLTI